MSDKLILHSPQPPSFGMNDMWKMANAIAEGGLFGSKDPNAVLTLCLLAQAEGQHPAVVLRDYHIISGKPSKKAEAMQRDFLAAGGRIVWHKLTDEECEATFSHPAGGEATISWDKARVKQAQLGSNPMHSKYPRQMLRSRVISEGVRTVFPGATSGLYETSEVQDMVAAEPRNITPVKDTPPLPPPNPAQEWLDGHIERINAAENMEALDRVFYNDGKRLTQLRQKHPDLHEKALEAGQVRADELRLAEVDA